MKIIISEDRLYKLTSKYLDNVFDDLKIIHPKGTRQEYYQFVDKDGKFIMDGIDGQELLVHTSIWQPLKSFFSLSDEQVIDAIEGWFMKNHGFSFNQNVVEDESFNY